MPYPHPAPLEYWIVVTSDTRPTKPSNGISHDQLLYQTQADAWRVAADIIADRWYDGFLYEHTIHVVKHLGRPAVATVEDWTDELERESGVAYRRDKAQAAEWRAEP